jgi:Holliday junction DNA helicase RuvA
MIAFIRGNVAAYGTDWIVVDNHGIGWQMAYPHPENVRLSRARYRVHSDGDCRPF